MSADNKSTSMSAVDKSAVGFFSRLTFCGAHYQNSPESLSEADLLATRSLTSSYVPSSVLSEDVKSRAVVGEDFSKVSDRLYRPLLSRSHS